MIKKVTLLAFMCVFALVVSVPNVLVLLQGENTVVLFDVSEEENKESETSKEKDIKIVELSYHASLVEIKNTLENTFYLKRYAPVHLGLLYPPPEISYTILN